MQSDKIPSIYAQEMNKLLTMPVFYILLFCFLAWNVYIFFSTEGYRLESIREAALQVEKISGSEEDYYENPDLKQVQKMAEKSKHFDQCTQALIEKNYGKLETRAKQIASETEERNSKTFTGLFHLHHMLFGKMFSMLILEGGILILLLLLYSLHYEKYQNTEDLVLSSRLDGKIYAVKLIVAAIYALILCGILCLLSLSCYFIAIDYRGIWQSYISSSANVEKRVVNDLYLLVYPYVTWKPMTLARYFALSLLLVFLLYLWIFLLSAAFSLFCEKSLTVLALLFSFLGILYVLGNGIMFLNMLEYILKAQPVHLMTKCGAWFTDYAPGDTYPLYEWLTMGIWNILTFVVFYALYRKKSFVAGNGEMCYDRPQRGKRWFIL